MRRKTGFSTPIMSARVGPVMTSNRTTLAS
jgi:hypothetical protein